MHCQVLIAGGGTGGITVASCLRRLAPELEVTVVEPSASHDYQSGWVLVAGGFMSAADTERSEASVMPEGVRWISSKVASFDPDQHALELTDGQRLTYGVLVVAIGIDLLWSAVDGLPAALGRDGVCSIYSRRFAVYTRDCLRRFQGGTALFTEPATAIKCGGAPQKIMHIADQQFKRRSGVGVNSRLIFCTAKSSLFPVPAFSTAMEAIAAAHGSEVRYRHNLVAVNGPERRAVFRVQEQEGGESQELELGFDLLHVVPPMAAPRVVAESPLAVNATEGWVEVDPHSGQHPRYPDVFAVGDVASYPTAKTGAGVRMQAPVVAANVLAVLQGRNVQPGYDGYSACPLITTDHSVMMVEFDYTNKPVSSFLVNPVKERWFVWLLERWGFPWIYWNRMLKAQPHEGAYLKPFTGLARRLGLMRWQS